MTNSLPSVWTFDDAELLTRVLSSGFDGDELLAVWAGMPDAVDLKRGDLLALQIGFGWEPRHLKSEQVRAMRTTMTLIVRRLESSMRIEWRS
ncbi:MAG: hypothetical protein ACYDHP_00690 [Ferrimicrobium sp.]